MNLGANWFYRPRLDEEMKRYEVLAFEKYLNRCLNEKAVFPAKSEMELQLNTVAAFKRISDRVLYERAEITEIDLKNAVLKYNYQNSNPGALAIVNQIADFLLKRISPFQLKFENLKKEIDGSITIDRVGVLPLHNDEGWLMIACENTIEIFEYRFQKVLNIAGNFQGNAIHRLSMYKHTSLAEAKRVLIRFFNDRPNPSTWFVSSNLSLPLETTYVPCALEKLSAIISA